MQPAELKSSDFANYRPVAQKTALEYLETLRSLPLGFVPFLLKEIISLDWKFPAEREDVLHQLAYLKDLNPGIRNKEVGAFTHLQLTAALESSDWVNLPSQFLEKLSAHLWASSQMDAFRTSSELYMKNFRTAFPEKAPSTPRVGIVLIGSEVKTDDVPLFRKLRREGTYFSNVTEIERGLDKIKALLLSRSSQHAAPYAHWFIDGGSTNVSDANVALVSYQNLASIRTALTSRIRRAFESQMSPEALRTLLASTTPADLGISPDQRDEVLDRFKVSLFTEGSGTQIYSTTFVQWTAREVLRRSKPLTVVARFTPRQREAPMSELLSGNSKNGTDPAGSLVDGDMGAWYTWISLQRLTGAADSSFLVWFEDHREAVAVGPGFAKAKVERSPVKLGELLNRLNSSPATARA
jgi:hypothetical protein